MASSSGAKSTKRDVHPDTTTSSNSQPQALRLMSGHPPGAPGDRHLPPSVCPGGDEAGMGPPGAGLALVLEARALPVLQPEARLDGPVREVERLRPQRAPG